MCDFDSDYQRWLEHAWPEDHKGGLLTRNELHARWFGSDIFDWLKGLFGVAEAAPAVTQSVSESLWVLLLYNTGDIELFGLQNFNTLCDGYGIVTVEPNFKLLGSVNIDVSLSGSSEAAVTLVDWDMQVSFPDPGMSSKYGPKDLQTPEHMTQPGDALFN
ncbi:hypothetical protein N0V93_010364 [Gnomoniopsis smithogilvyi]|uniref:Uncharacterized protein n=1 Tax=Gnomoniopsis smithogilvyi TaxID=1191159 RepID=A0A9W8YIL9_9PEZI|nr:hypothetical protein N0V93_010364 [Gnomoniopsis smithogilvyi]